MISAPAGVPSSDERRRRSPSRRPAALKRCGVDRRAEHIAVRRTGSGRRRPRRALSPLWTEANAAARAQRARRASTRGARCARSRRVAAFDADQRPGATRAALQLVEQHRLLGRRRRRQERRQVGDVVGARTRRSAPRATQRRARPRRRARRGARGGARRRSCARRAHGAAARRRPARSSSPSGRRRRAAPATSRTVGLAAARRAPTRPGRAGAGRAARARASSARRSPRHRVSNSRSSASRLPVSVPRIASTITAASGDASSCIVRLRSPQAHGQRVAVDGELLAARLQRLAHEACRARWNDEPARRLERAVEHLDAALSRRRSPRPT